MRSHRLILAGAAAIALTAFPASSMARDFQRQQAVVGGNGLPSVVPGVGTFAGSIAAVRIKGNGIYFYQDNTRRPTVVPYRTPKVQIIEISEDAPDEACSFEAGVCVIRP